MRPNARSVDVFPFAEGWRGSNIGETKTIDTNTTGGRLPMLGCSGAVAFFTYDGGISNETDKTRRYLSR